MPNNPIQPKAWHLTVDANEIIQHLPFDENGWHAGDGVNGIGNRQSVAIEICMNSDGDRSKAEENAARLVAKLLLDFNLPIERVKQHHNWSGKNCPSVLRGRVHGWEEFLSKIAAYLDGDDAPVAIPIISPLGGVFQNPTEVTISCATPSSLIRYTTDGTEPNGSSPLYESRLMVKGFVAIKAKAFLVGHQPSPVVSAAFSVSGGVAAAPAMRKPSMDGSGFTVSVESEIGFSYILEFKDVISHENWTVAATLIGNGRTLLFHGSAPASPQRIYRLRVQKR